MESTDDIYRLRAEVRDLADEISRWTPWRDAGGAGGGGFGSPAVVGAGGLGAATAIDGPGTGTILLYDYDADPPAAAADPVEALSPFRVRLDPGSTVVVIPTAGGRWFVVSAECAAS